MQFKHSVSTVLVVMLYCIAETFQQLVQELPVTDLCADLPKSFENSTSKNFYSFLYCIFWSLMSLVLATIPRQATSKLSAFFKNCNQFRSLKNIVPH